ncbi:DUF2062 domain-containing protein [Brevibacillus sp. TJ4]|uniref:DUF2062 domain-containing protein n=1 Tax=Brevibacillus sp. TJ4 TaxID=3234853 RepID=UPI0037D95A2B
MLTRLFRSFKYAYYKLLRSKGAPSFIALGFALGIFLEFLTLPTFGIAFLLLFPLTRLFRCSKSSALTGFVTGKLVLPVFFIPILQIGYALAGYRTYKQTAAPSLFHGQWLAWIRDNGIAYLIGSTVIGLCLACLSYLAVLSMLRWFRHAKARRISNGSAS